MENPHIDASGGSKPKPGTSKLNRVPIAWKEMRGELRGREPAIGGVSVYTVQGGRMDPKRFSEMFMDSHNGITG